MYVRYLAITRAIADYGEWVINGGGGGPIVASHQSVQPTQLLTCVAKLAPIQDVVAGQWVINEERKTHCVTQLWLPALESHRVQSRRPYPTPPGHHQIILP